MVGLAAQLGYTISPEELASRLAAYAGRGDCVALVAEEAGKVIGFANGSLRLDLVYEPMVELEALVVAGEARGRGVGRQLLAAFENWAVRHAKVVKLGSRDSRKDAHRFYVREGYGLEKLHHIYRKRLK